MVGSPDERKVSFYNPKPEPDTITWISEAEAFAEIKEGSIYNETFEAMAGVPTTSDLYFSVGGSEFIAEITAQRLPDQEVWRTYRSYYSGTASEFKMGDRAGNYTVGGFSLNGHTGGSRTKTWSGSVPWTGSVTYSDHSGSVSDSWDFSAADAAYAEAVAYAADVNATTIEFTAASDGVPRSYNSWGASVSGSKNQGSGGWVSIGQDYIAPTPPSGDPPTGGDPGQPYIATTGGDGTAGSYSWSVTVTLPAHKLCGPDHEHDLPPIQDTWKQKITYDSMKILSVNIWEIQRGYVDGMTRIIGTDSVTATIKQGDPNIFYNIAATESSANGRLRYTVEPQQHDVVVWYEGVRSNKSDGMGTNPYADDSPGGGGHGESYATGILYTNGGYTNTVDYHVSNSSAKDKATPEYAKFDQRRDTLNTVTVISDFVILQTSSGDQALLYFDKASNTVSTQTNFDDMEVSFDELWTNNTEAASHLTPDNINIGSYGGKFYNTNSKYAGSGDDHRTTTVLDNDPAGTISRPSRPSNLRIYTTGLDIPDTTPNGEYTTGNAKVFYNSILSRGPAMMFTPTYDADFGATGLVIDAPYSSAHSKVNDIVIHNPVSAQYAIVLPVSNSLDQRTAASSAIGGNLQQDIQEFVTKLKDPHPKQNFIVNGDAEQVTNSGKILNWSEFYTGDESLSLHTRRTEPTWTISDTGSFEVRKTADSNIQAGYESTIMIEPNTAYEFTGKIGVHRATGYFTIDALNATGAILQSWTSSTHSSSTVTTKNINFTTPANTTHLRVRMYLVHDGVTTSTWDYLFVDDLSITAVSGATDEWVPIAYEVANTIQVPNPDYVTPYTIPNPEYVPEHQIPNPAYIADIPPVSNTYNYTGGVQTFTAPVTGTYVLEAWGAQGGSTPGNNYGGYGGYAKSVVTLNANQTVYIYVGGKGGNSPSSSIDGSTSSNSNGGWNYGGNGAGTRGPGGGGRTDIRTSTSSTSELVVGGGGGAGIHDSHRTGVSIQHSQYTRVNGGPGQSGHTGSYPRDNGGGGAGYYGGRGSTGDDSSYGHAGSNYAIGSGATSYYGARSGHGMARITAPGQTGNGEPEFLTIPASGGDPTITINNAHYVPAVVTGGSGSGDSRTFNNTSTGYMGANSNNSSGALGGSISMSGGIYYWTVPATGTYEIDVYGAQGGNGTGSGTSTGGRGARVRGEFDLTVGQRLKILVGQQGGSNSAGGGGGGSFVTYDNNVPLIVAGGGGGGLWLNY